MLRITLGVSVLALAVSATARAQEVRVSPSGSIIYAATAGGHIGGKLGLSVASGSPRDTLGLLVTSLVPEGPAEKAGLIEGDRLQAVNGVSLRLSAADAGEPDMAMILRRRLERELAKVDSGETVSLRVWSAGRTREVTVRAGADARRAITFDAQGTFRTSGTSNRPVLGVSLAATGTVRDTLGVFITAVELGGPAERAGIIEGQRIASINGVDLRVPAADAGDPMVASTKSSRLAREIEKLEPGARVQLRVWSDGHYRDVSVELGRYGDVYKDRPTGIRIGGGTALVAPGVILRSLPGGPPDRPEPLDSLWRRRDEIRRSVDPRLAPDTSGGTLHFRFDDRIRQEIERSLQQLRQFHLAPSRAPVITTRTTI